MSLNLFSNLFAPLRRRALLWCTLVLLLFASASTLAVQQSANNSKPRASRPARGGGPQTGTGTSDVVRAIVPPKSQG